MEIKKNEVIASFVIISIMLMLGFGFSGKIRRSLLEDYLEYDTAAQIDSEDLFLYGMETNIGNAFVYGNLETIDPVTFPELDGEYSYVKKEEQLYQNHPKPVTKTYKDSNGVEHTDTEWVDDWSWDTIHTYQQCATRISFLNVEFAYRQIPFPSSRQIKTISTGNHRRNVYYGTGTSFKGTIFTKLKNDTINNTSFYHNQTISETIERLESGYQIVLFGILWILLTAGFVVGFCYAENRWLDQALPIKYKTRESIDISMFSRVFFGGRKPNQKNLQGQ